VVLTIFTAYGSEWMNYICFTVRLESPKIVIHYSLKRNNMSRFHLINVFVAVVDTNGFAGAARKLKISPPAVTRAINDLESQLGVRLLTRTTRVVKVTEAGARYAQDCRRILAEMQDADESVVGMHGAPRGHITVTAPVLFGAKFVAPIVSEYLHKYPLADVSCLFLDRVVNMLEEGVDVGIRIGELADSSMQAVRVGQVRRMVCASPSYLSARGTPQVPADLQQHCIVSASSVHATPEWRFSHRGILKAIKIYPRMSTSTNDSAIAAVVGGFGVTRLLSYQIAEQLKSGQLIAVLQDYELEPIPVHVVHREGRYASQKVRAFLDMAITRLRDDSALN
jgi:DNA-binding transcriptional LysR family regulator